MMKCRDCKGKKTYRGAGMYAPEDCHHCRGTGEEPVDGAEKCETPARDKFAQVREYAPKSERIQQRYAEGDFPRPPKTLQKAYGGDVEPIDTIPKRTGGDIVLHPGTQGDVRLRGGEASQQRGGPVRPPSGQGRPAGQVTYGLTDCQRAEVQGTIREAAEPLERQIGALQQEVARLREPRSRPEEQVISNTIEVEPGASRRITLRPTNGGCESYELQRMLVSAMPVDLVNTNGERIELPVIIESCGTTSAGHIPVLLADVVSTAGLLEVSGLIGVISSQELTVQVKNPTREKVLVTAAVWVVERKPESLFNRGMLFNQDRCGH